MRKFVNYLPWTWVKIKTLKFLPYIWTISQPVGLPAKHWRPRVKQRSPQESQPAQHRAHLASGAAALGWLRTEDGRRTHAQRSLLQRAPRRKVRPWCSKKALQRPAEETACTCRNQPSVMAAGGLRPRQLALICEKSQFRVQSRGIKPQRKNTGGRRSEQHPYHPHPEPSSVQSAPRIGLYGHQWACKNGLSAFPEIFVCKKWAIIIKPYIFICF